MSLGHGGVALIRLSSLITGWSHYKVVSLQGGLIIGWSHYRVV